MTDLAALGLTVRSDGVVVATDRLEDFKDASDKAGQGADKVGKKSNVLSGSLRKLAGVAGIVAIGVASIFSSQAIISGISDFETSMSKVAAITRATDGDLANLRQTAMDLGIATEFSAGQAADALGFLGMAGFTATESIAAIPAVLDLATASGMGLADAADTASNIMSGFGIAADNAAQVADVLAAASSRANTNVAQLGSAMSTVAPISAALGIDLADTAAAIGVLSDAGIQGERAGTALRGVMASLAGPTTAARDALANYGLTAADVDPATSSLAEVMGRLQAAGLSTADAMTIFGREAASGALVLAGSSERLREFGDELRNVDGAASGMAGTMRDNLGGDLAGLQSALAGLILALGDAGLTAILRTVVQALTDVVRVVSGNVVPAFEAMGVAIAVVASTQIPSLVIGLAGAVSGMTASTVAAGVLAGAMRLLGAAVALAGGPFGILAALLVAGASYFLLFGDNAGVAETAQYDAAKGTAALNAALGTFYSTAAPSAGKAAIDLANDNYKLAASAYEAAKGEIAKAKAQVASVRETVSIGGGTLSMEAEARLSAIEASKVRDLIKAENALEQAIRDRKVAANAVTGSMSETMSKDVEAARELKVSVEGLDVALKDLGTGSGSGSSGSGGGAKVAKDAVDELEKSMKKAKAAQEAWAKNAAGHFDGLITGGKTFSGVLQSIASQLESKAWEGLFGLFNGGGTAAPAPASGGGGGFLSGLLSGVGSWLQSFSGGGYTGDGPRSGGLDGQGGRLAMIHPRETVVDHMRPQNSAQGGASSITLRVISDAGVTVQQVGQIATGVAVQVVQSGMRQTQRALPSQLGTLESRGTT